MNERTDMVPAHELKALSRELQRVNRTLRRLTCTDASRRRWSRPPEINAAAVRAIVAARRLRDEHFGAELDDQAWSVLLEAFAARLDGRASAMNRVGAATGIARSTAHRRVAWLLDRGLLVRQAGRSNGSGAVVGPSEDAAGRIAAYLAAAARISPWL